MMKRFFAALLCACALIQPAAGAAAAPEVEAGAAVLMERETGTVLYESHSHDKLEPASVTKIMTLLLVMEAIDGGTVRLEDVVTVSSSAAAMGGSQVYLKEGEQMTVDELLKAVAVVSANDAAVALAEHLAGSEAAFVERMDRRAAELGMKDTNFVNCTGLPAAGHLTSAYDIALMSRALMAHPKIRDYTTIWMDTIRGGQFQLSNTNKLVRFYSGCTGLKTGSTDSALYCLSATAEREGMELIAVVLKSPTSQKRFDGARALLDYGFANYTLLDVGPDEAIPPVEVRLGEVEQVQPILGQSGRILVEKAQLDPGTTQVRLAEDVEAPVEQGQKLGEGVVPGGWGRAAGPAPGGRSGSGAPHHPGDLPQIHAYPADGGLRSYQRRERSQSRSGGDRGRKTTGPGRRRTVRHEHTMCALSNEVLYDFFRRKMARREISLPAGPIFRPFFHIKMDIGHKIGVFSFFGNKNAGRTVQNARKIQKSNKKLNKIYKPYLPFS